MNKSKTKPSAVRRYETFMEWLRWFKQVKSGAKQPVSNTTSL